jgi:glycosyltransferase involved in cell wall biosynthesis
VEALASGASVVVTDAGGPREIAAGATPGSARLVPPGDADALADAILAALAEAGASTTTSRQGRPPRRMPEPDRFAALFRSVSAERPGG